MDFIANTVDQINWWAIALATLSTLPVGYVWYDMKLGAGQRWAKLNKIKVNSKDASKGMAQTFSVMLLTSLFTAFILACVMISLGISDFWGSLYFGLVVGVVFRGGAHFVHNGFTRRPLELAIIDAGHDMFSIAVMAIILGMWR